MKRAIALMILGTAGTASADKWMSAELPTAVAVSDVQEQAFRPGAMPAVGAYLSLGSHFAIGVRGRAGVLRDRVASPLGGNRMDISTGGLATAGLAGRVIFGGAYFELVAGGGITGSDIVPTFEGGIGYLFDFEHVSVGPSARYVRVQAASADALGSADLLLVGVDFQLGHEHHRVIPVQPAVDLWTAPDPAPPPPAPPPQVAYDADPIVDALPSCADLLEYLDDTSGCGTDGGVEVAGDRIILDDRVLFDTDHARVHTEGRAIIRAIAKAAAHHPEWTTLTIEGHADVRGTDGYNQVLSEARAERVRDQMVKAGFAADRIKTVGFGRSHPRDPGTTPEAHHRNRRVEFVIDRASHTVGVTP
ncbi:MAG: OmpA family protein [Kofleriaceae bacterium]